MNTTGAAASAAQTRATVKRPGLLVAMAKLISW
jgi:hypothetical protein